MTTLVATPFRIRSVHCNIDQEFPEHLRRVQQFLRIPSFSTNRQQLQRAAGFLQEAIQRCGGTVEFMGSADAPIVFGTVEAGKPRTLIIYGMYDVQPVAGQRWGSDPFAAEVRQLPGIGECVVARGACNSKGPLLGFLNSVESILRSTGELPVNLLLVLEGQEEVGSPGLESFLMGTRDRLRAVAVFEPFWAEYGTDVSAPTIGLGTKGIVSFRLVCRSGDWGGPRTRPVHSSVAACIASPTWRLLRALAALTDEHDQLRVDELQKADWSTPDDERLLLRLAEQLAPGELLSLTDAARFKFADRGVNLLRKYYFAPTVQVSHLHVDDADTIPTHAEATLAVRLVPGMRPAETLDAVRRFLAGLGLRDLEIVDLGGYPGTRTPADSAVVQALLAAYEFHECTPRVVPLFASSSPWSLFKDILGIPYTSGGLGKAGGSHGVDEFFTVDGLRQFELSIATFLHQFGESS